MKVNHCQQPTAIQLQQLFRLGPRDEARRRKLGCKSRWKASGLQIRWRRSTDSTLGRGEDAGVWVSARQSAEHAPTPPTDVAALVFGWSASRRTRANWETRRPTPVWTNCAATLKDRWWWCLMHAVEVSRRNTEREARGGSLGNALTEGEWRRTAISHALGYHPLHQQCCVKECYGRYSRLGALMWKSGTPRNRLLLFI